MTIYTFDIGLGDFALEVSGSLIYEDYLSFIVLANAFEAVKGEKESTVTPSCRPNEPQQ